jgi:glycogen phosphorylase
MDTNKEDLITRNHVLIEDDRTGMSLEALKRAIVDNLLYTQARPFSIATPNDVYMAFAHTIRDRLIHRWIHTSKTYMEKDVRVVSYLSAEFLLGPQLANNLINLDIYNRIKQAAEDYGLNLNDILELEEEPGLGNGGLGRLAACYLDSLATLQIPAIGYGIRYEFGIFDQQIHDGWQVEITDKWLAPGNPWEIPRPEIAFEIKLGGHTETHIDSDGHYGVRWIPNRVVKGVAYDTPVLGFKVNTCNTLRLWKAEAVESFDFEDFNRGDYYGAVEEKVNSENLTKVLYPNDEQVAGKQLRLEQQFFFVSCALQDMIRMHLMCRDNLNDFHDKFSIQLNDTHPSIAVAELMRLLLDEHALAWDKAWKITTRALAFTNHTLLPEALERWPLSLFARVLPRHLEIIYEINHRFLETVKTRFPDDSERISRMSLIDESGNGFVRMANLACVGSRAINGVAALHTELLKKRVLHDFFEMMPEKFSNKTNGVTPRRFMVLSNPRLTRLINREIGDDWITRLEELRKLEPLADNPEFQEEWHRVKRANKRALGVVIRNQTGIRVDPDSIFDIQVKRIHEYKRQHLNILHIITLYNRIKQDPNIDITPRTFIFAGKAAPGYFMAKLFIKLIHSVGDRVNTDPDVGDRMKVVFLPDFNVKNAHRIYPAADLSEQISTAGYEASGTGNMKFALNAALTIGTLDGANVEMREEVGAENFFLFGLTADEIVNLRSSAYDPWEYYRENEELKQTIDQIRSGFFSPNEPDLFKPLTHELLNHDTFMLMADYTAYIDCQAKVDQAFKEPGRWNRMSILNTARMGKFSSDRSMREYCDEIWHVRPVPIQLDHVER